MSTRSGWRNLISSSTHHNHMADRQKQFFLLNKTVGCPPRKLKRIGTWCEISTLAFLDHNGRGDHLLGGCDDGTMHLWNIQDTDNIRRQKWVVSRNACVHTIAINNSKIVTGSDDPILKQWNVNREQPVRLFSDHEREILSAGFNQDGTIIASTGLDWQLNLWHLDVREPVFKINTQDCVLSTSFVGSSSNLLLVTTKSEWRLIDLRMHKSFSAMVKQQQFFDRSEIENAFGISNPHLNTNGTDGNDTTNNNDTGTKTEFDTITAMVMPSSNTTSSEQDLRQSSLPSSSSSLRRPRKQKKKSFDRERGIYRNQFQGHSHDIVDITSLEDQNEIATTDANGMVCVWDLYTGKGRRSLVREGGGEGSNVRTATGLKGKVIVGGGNDGTLNVWDTQREDVCSRTCYPKATLQCGDFSIRSVTANSDFSSIAASDSAGGLFVLSPCSTGVLNFYL